MHIQVSWNRTLKLQKTKAIHFATNDAARVAFKARRESGLGLSDKVWRYTEQFRDEIEAGIDIGLRDGLPASKMATELKRYLQRPNELFRRVRDEHGILHLSKRAKAYHPGAGVYRSSYKNAMRLARTEPNIAYHTADHDRWQQFDFVVGIEVVLSNNHTCLGPDGKPHPFTDICDELAGRYPKDFKFTGWHPNCRCSAKTILKTDEEMEEETMAILQGKEPPKESVNAVKELPPQFTKWMDRNADRIAAARKNGTLPYFLRDNEKFIKRQMDYSDVYRKITKGTSPDAVKLFSSFEPFSPIIIQTLDKLKNKRDRNKLFESIYEDERIEVLNVTDKNIKTVVFPNHKGKKSKSWKETKQMALFVNRYGSPVCFLPEYENSISADAIIRFKGNWVLADFKCASTANYNTIAEDVIHGYKQAGTVVLQIKNGNTETFKQIVDQVLRKSGGIGNVVLINKYGKVREIDRKLLINSKYLSKIRGFL